MRKCSGSPIPTIPKKDAGFYKELTFSVDCTGINVDVRTVRVWSSGDRGERTFPADWDA